MCWDGLEGEPPFSEDKETGYKVRTVGGRDWKERRERAMMEI